MDKLLTTREVADILRMRVETITRKAEQGQLPAIKVGGRWRVPEERFQSWLRDMERRSPSLRAGASIQRLLKLKTYRTGGTFGSLSRREIYEDR